MQIVNINQVRGNKNNPRVIKDERFKKLVESIKFFPEMLWKRCLVVESNEKGFTVLGGNQRLRAINEIFKMPRHELAEQVAGVNNEKTILAFYDSKQIPITLCDDWTLEQKREFIVRDNIDFGSWDMDKLSTDYEMDELEEMGLIVDYLENEKIEIDNFETDESEQEDAGNIESYRADVLFKTNNKFQMPEYNPKMLYEGSLKNLETYHPTLMGHPYNKDNKYFFVWQNVGIKDNDSNLVLSFYTKDYKFEDLFIDPGKYLDKIKERKFISFVTPNYTLHKDMPYPVRIFRHYKARWIARYFQEAGLYCIPELEFSTDEKRLDIEFVIDGLPRDLKYLSIQNQQGFNDDNEKEFYCKTLQSVSGEIKIDTIIIYCEKYSEIIKNNLKAKNYIVLKSINEVIKHGKSKHKV
jgi:hypothetical protein